VSYTLRGRIETRLAGALPTVMLAALLSPILHKWWPLELVGLMLLIGLVLDVAVYRPLLPYQPGWAAVPLGLLELGLTVAAARTLELGAPLRPALLLFAATWLFTQLLAHAGLPLLRLSWPEDGGELGAIVQGGIVVTADDVTLRNLTVRGGDYGIEVREAESVEIDDVVVESAELDGINARQSEVAISDCEIRSLPGRASQGIDISFASQLPPSVVEDCVIVGGSEGIVSHMANVMVRDNRVRSTELRGIAVTEMSMGDVDDNLVENALGIGIFCGDYSHCSIKDNRVTGMRTDPSGNPTRAGLGLVAHYWAIATVAGNTLERPPASFIGARIESR